MKNCYNCKFASEIPGNAHISCDIGMNILYKNINEEILNKIKEIRKENKNLIPIFNPISIRLMLWPLNVDPTFLENCNLYSEATK